MKILALNCGSSSIKSAVFEIQGMRQLLAIRIENIGGPKCILRVANDVRVLPAATEGVEATRRLLSEWRDHEGVVGKPMAVVHRVVHGGNQFVRPVMIDDAVLNQLDELSSLAPLHNPPAVAAIRLAREAYPEAKHIATFDTSFHATLPRRAREYALPTDLRARFGIRRYGFHGLSHAHVMRSVAKFLRRKPQELRIISCHLGNGASIAAIEYGRSVETSMGMTPLEGLVMGTRAGDIDAGVLLWLLQDAHMELADMDRLLNRESGLKGLTGTQNMQEIETRAADDDEECRLALQVYAHRIRKYIGAYAASMGGVDAIAFTGGVGENSAVIRHRSVQRMGFLGATLHEGRNRDARVSETSSCLEISEAESRVRLLVVRADEESAMAREAVRILEIAGGQLKRRIPIAVSARHAHLSQPTLDRLFGMGCHLHVREMLAQTGQFAAREVVTLIGPRGRIEGVRVLGPPRNDDQIEISRSDEFVLGVDAPVRISGDLANTPGVTVEGPAGRVSLPSGLICARRHIHMSTEEADELGVRDHDIVAVRVASKERELVFGDVVVRVAPDFRLQMHLDTDEANAAGVRSGDYGELLVG